MICSALFPSWPLALPLTNTLVLVLVLASTGACKGDGEVKGMQNCMKETSAVLLSCTVEVCIAKCSEGQAFICWIVTQECSFWSPIKTPPLPCACLDIPGKTFHELFLVILLLPIVLSSVGAEHWQDGTCSFVITCSPGTWETHHPFFPCLTVKVQALSLLSDVSDSFPYTPAQLK